MNGSKPPLLLRSNGISPWEQEVLFSLLHGLFEVTEDSKAVEDENFTTTLEITFPFEFNEAFFKWFGISRWDKTKGIIKEMKRRRGSGNSLLVNIKFKGNPSVKFTIDLDEKHLFDTAVDKIDFVLELIPYHLNPKKLSGDTTEASYYFDGMIGKWNLNFESLR